MNNKFPKFKKKEWKDILDFQKFEDLISEQKIKEYQNNFIDLAENMLQYNPKKRITIKNVIEYKILQ